MKAPLTTDRILNSDGKHAARAAKATPEHRANANLLCQRVNALLTELGVDEVEVNDGFRDSSVTYGAAKSAHKEAKAVDLKDKAKALSSKITKELLQKHKLRREDNDDTPTWCHLDTRQPYGIFKP